MPKHAMLPVLLLCLGGLSCRGRDAAAAHPGPAGPALKPAPGADLDALPPPPARTARHIAARGGRPLDLGADRPIVPIPVPAPPRGGAAGFSFGDGHDGWVARIPESLQLPAVAYGDGRVYVSGGFESVSFYALDAGDGHMVWSSQGLEDNGPTAPLYDEGRVVFNTESCTLFVLDGKTGKKLWHKYLGDPTLAQPAVQDGLVFASHPGKTGPELSAYRLRDGTEVWTRTVGGELLAAPVLSGDSVYASTIGGRTFRFRRTSGEKVWSRPLHATSAPWIEGDRLYLSRREGGREAQVVVSAATGAILRTDEDVAAPADVPATLDDWKKIWAFEGSRPVVLGGVRYAAMGSDVVASDPRTGERLWIRQSRQSRQSRRAKAASEREMGTVAIAGPTLVVSTRKGQIFGLDVDTGYTLWAYDLGRPVTAEPIIARGWIYATTTGGEVIALHVADSTLDGWHMFGGNPQHDGLIARR